VKLHISVVLPTDFFPQIMLRHIHAYSIMNMVKWPDIGGSSRFWRIYDIPF